MKRIYTSQSDCARMAYLNHLIRLGRSHGKRADWLKFCKVCGADISRTPKLQRLCEDCRAVLHGVEPVRKEDR